VLVALGVVLAWYGPAVGHYGVGYLRETVVHQQLERYTRTWVHQAPWYYYLPEFVAGFLPWSLFLPGALGLGWRAWRQGDPVETAAGGTATPPPLSRPWLFPLAWFASGFVFFSLSTGKRGAYLLPLYPAAALLVAWLWSRAGAGRSRWLGVPIALMSGGAALLAVAMLVMPRRWIPGTMVDTLVPADLRWQVVATATLLGGAAAVWLTWRRGRPWATLAAIVIVQAVCLHVVTAVRAPQYEARYPARALAADIRARVPDGESLLSLLGDYDFLVAFYLDRPITPLPGPSELLAARARATRYALVDGRERAILDAPGIHTLLEGRLGPRRVVLVRLDPGTP
jgi:4-amino-4-deoxy-L-arabinose transferase-like glycosyltransferase